MQYIIGGFIGILFIVGIVYSMYRITRYSYREEIKQYNKAIREIEKLFASVSRELEDVYVTKVVYDDFEMRIGYIRGQIERANVGFLKALKKHSKKDIEFVLDMLDELQNGVYEARLLYSKSLEIRDEWEREQRLQKAKEEYEEYMSFEKVISKKSSGYFTGCTTKKQLKTRFRELVKKHHPDNGGDRNAFEDIQNEYENMLKRISL